MNVRSSGIRIWSKGEMTLKSEDIAGEGQEITAEAGDYVWIGSGSSGIAVLPDQIQVSAANIYMESPLSGIHKISEEKSPEMVLMEYEEAKKMISPPILTEEGKIITRDGYDEILYSPEMYDFFNKYVIGKVPGYEWKHDEPYATLYEQWLDEMYGHSAMWHFWNYAFSIDGLQALLAIGGFFRDECDLVNTAIYLLRGKWKEAGLSAVMAIPIIGSRLGFKKFKIAAGLGDLASVTKSDDIVTDLIVIYRAQENSMELFSEIGAVSEKMLRNMNYSSGGWGISQDIFYHNLSVTIKIVDSAGEVIDMVKIGKNGKKIVYGGSESPSKIAKSWQGSGKYPGVDDYSDVVINKGTILYRGEPNGTGYFTTLDSIEKSGRDATTIFQGLQ